VGTVQPSSLIFLLVIAIWAAFLVQHWLGRRENLVTARTVDRFSESMRILDRGTGVAPMAEAPAPSASAARVHRPQATVARAEAILGGVADSPVIHRARSAGGRAVAGTRRAGSRAASASTTRTMPVFGRATRGVLVMAAFTLTVLTSLLAILNVVGLRFPLVALVLTGAALWWLRRGVAAEAAARRARRGAGRAASGRAPVSGHRPTSPHGAAPSRFVRAPRPSASSVEPVTAAPESSAPVAMREKLYDLAAIEEVEKQEAADAAAREGWQPVPVPPPTYTMKAKAVYADPVADEDDDIASPYAEEVTDLTDYAAERARLASG